MHTLNVTSYNIIDSFRFLDEDFSITLYKVWKGLSYRERTNLMSNEVCDKVEVACGKPVKPFVYCTFFEALEHQHAEYDETGRAGDPYFEMVFKRLIAARAETLA